MADSSDQVSIGLVGGGAGGSALLDLLLDWPAAKLAVVVDPRLEAPALQKARTLGIPTAAKHLDVYTYPVTLVFEVTGQPAVLEDLLRAKPAGVQVIGAESLRFFWDLLQDKVKATGGLQAQLDLAMALGPTPVSKEPLAVVTRKLAEACGVDRCACYLWDEGTGFITPIMAQFATGERNERMWNAFRGVGKLKLTDVPFFSEVIERKAPIEITDPASDHLTPPGWAALFQIKSALVVPIFRQDRVAGACTLDYSREPRRFTPEQIALAVSLVGQVSLALENARLYQQAEERGEKLATLSALTSLVTRATDSQQVFHALARAATTLLGAKLARVWIADPAARVLRVRADFGPDPNFVQRASDVTVIPYGAGLAGRVFESRAPEYVVDIQQDSRWLDQRLARELDLHAYAGIPLISGDTPVGIMAITFGDRRRFNREEKEVLGLLADHAAIAIQNARLYEESGQRQREAEVLAQLARALNESLDLSTVLQRVTEGAKELCGSDMARIALWGQQVDAMVFRYWVGSRYQGYDAIRITAGKGVGGQIMLTGRPFRTDDYAEDPRITKDYIYVAEAEGFITELAVPILIKDRVEGLLFVDNRSPRPFSDRDEAILLRLADHAAIAIQNARLYAETERRRRAAESLADLGRVISQSLDPEEVGRRIADSIRALCDAQASTLYRLEPETGDLTALAVSGDVGPAFGRNPVFPRGTGVAGLAVRERRPVFTPDLLADPRVTLTPELRGRIEQATYRSVLAVPLMVQDAVIGALGVGDREGRVFGEEEIRLAQTFADQAAIALENARLYTEVAQRRREAEEVAQVARTLTESLDFASVAELICESATPLFGVQSAVLRLLQPDGSLLAITSHGPHRPHFDPGHVLPSQGGGVTTEAVARGVPVWSRDALNDPAIALNEEMRRRVIASGNRAALAAPLRVKGRIIGVLTIADRIARDFSQGEVELLQTFADHAAIALENSRLYGDLRAALEKIEASQERIVRTERLRALGEMAAGVAHDFNNLLAVILGRTDLLLTRVQDPEVARALRAVRTAALDGAQTVRRIQEFTRTRRTRPFGRVDVRELVQDVVELTRPRWENEAQSRGVPYEVTVEAEPVSPVAGIMEELREVFTNVLINALEAMPGGGRLVFRVTGEADEVVVSAADTGCGMSEETRRRVFEPFFTTKGPRGTGLGLAVAWGIVTRHGGTIDLESTLGVGSTFTVRLPTARGVVPEESPAAAAPPARPARVLVIEDEPAVRLVVKEILTHAGYTVMEAADGAEGLVRCEVEAVDLVLSDLSMPGMSGWEVAAACRERFPQVPVGFITGWGDQLDPERLERHRIQFVLAKPFAPGDLLNRVARALAE